MKKEVETSEIIEWFIDKSKVRHDSDLSEDEIKSLLSLHLTGLAEKHDDLSESMAKTFAKFSELE